MHCAAAIGLVLFVTIAAAEGARLFEARSTQPGSRGMDIVARKWSDGREPR